MANQFVNTDWVSEEILRLLLNKLVVAENFNTSWTDDFTQEFAVGSTVRIKFPQRFTSIDGMGYDPQGINRIYTTVALDQWIQVPFEWNDYEVAVNLERSEEELREQYWEPASAELAQQWDSRAAQWAFLNSTNVMGAMGTDPTTVSIFQDARARLGQKAAQRAKIVTCISSSAMASLSTNLTNLFNPQMDVSKAFKEGYYGRVANSDLYESQSLYRHTIGTAPSHSVTVTGANQSGNALIITGTNGDTINRGDRFTIANVNGVNPMTRRASGANYGFVYTASQDYTLTAGPDTINVVTTVYGPGSQYQNVDALPADGAALTFWPGTTNPSGVSGTVGFMLNKFAFAMIAGQLYKPKAVEKSGLATDPQTKMSIRFVHAWDPVRSMNIHRFDSLGGFGNLYQDNNVVAIAAA